MSVRAAEFTVIQISYVSHLELLRNNVVKKNVTCVKRVKSILENGFFVQGDNSDPLASEDSHNFGPIKKSAIIAILKS